jgi:hypothetical protein
MPTTLFSMSSTCAYRYAKTATKGRLMASMAKQEFGVSTKRLKCQSLTKPYETCFNISALLAKEQLFD